MFGRLARYEDVNDADRLGRDPTMRWVVGGRAVTDYPASTSQMGRFETGAMTSAQNLTALADLSGCWVDSDRWAAPTRRGTMPTSGRSAVAPSSRPTCVCRRLDDRHPGARVVAAHCVDSGRLESGHVRREIRCQTRPGGLDHDPQRASARSSGECRLIHQGRQSSRKGLR